VTSANQQANMDRQLAFTPRTLEELRKLGVDSRHLLRIEYFFYTNTESKAQALAGDLRQLGYDVGVCPSAHDKRIILVTGWSVPLPMSEQRVGGWTREMCELAAKHDCDFDGWGTTPAQ